MSEIKKLKELQEQVKEAMKKLIKETMIQVRNTPPLDGVSIMNGDVRGCTVRTSAIKDHNCMSPRYFLPGCQVNAVESRLLTDGLSLDQFEARLNEMLEKKKADGTPLNPNTLMTLQRIKDELDGMD